MYIVDMCFRVAVTDFLNTQDNESFNFLVAACVATHQNMFLYATTPPKRNNRSYVDFPEELFLVTAMLLTDQKEELLCLLR